MPRRKKCRRICREPEQLQFVPDHAAAQQIVMTVDELETVRLLDYEGLTQEQCAQQMNVGRPTVTAIYEAARKKLAAALVERRLLKVEGGDYAVCKNAESCCGKCGGGACEGCRRESCGRKKELQHEQTQ